MRTNAATTGSVVLTLVGSNLGTSDYSGRLRIGETACESSEWTSDSSLQCKASAGVVSSLSGTMTVSQESSVLSQAISYDGARLSTSVGTNAPTTGSVVLTLVGSNFGTSDYSGRLPVGDTACESS